MHSKKIDIPYGLDKYSELSSMSRSLAHIRSKLDTLTRKGQKTKNQEIGSQLFRISGQLNYCRNDEHQFHYHMKMERALKELLDELRELTALYDTLYQALPSYFYAIPKSTPEPVYISPSEEVKKQGCHHDEGAIQVAKYIVQEIQTNAKSKEVERIRYFTDFEGRQREWLSLPPLKRALMPRPEPELIAALGFWTMQVKTNGPWDHKPLIREKFRHLAVKERPYNSIEDDKIILFSSYIHKYKNHDYFYDVWSNIHYGYIGMLCGFSEALLLNGAGMEQIVDDLLRLKLPKNKGENAGILNGFDGIADRESVSLGIRLFRQFGNNAERLTHQAVLDGLESIKNLGPSRLKHVCFDTSETKITEE